VIYIAPKSHKRIRAHRGWALGGGIGQLKVVGTSTPTIHHVILYTYNYYHYC